MFFDGSSRDIRRPIVGKNDSLHPHGSMHMHLEHRMLCNSYLTSGDSLKASTGNRRYAQEKKYLQQMLQKRSKAGLHGGSGTHFP